MIDIGDAPLLALSSKSVLLIVFVFPLKDVGIGKRRGHSRDFFFDFRKLFRC